MANLAKMNLDAGLPPRPKMITDWGKEVDAFYFIDKQFKVTRPPVFIFEHCQATFTPNITRQIDGKASYLAPKGEGWVYTCADGDWLWFTRGPEYDVAD